MMAHLGLFAPILKRLASVAVKVAINSMAATWPALSLSTPSDSLSNLPLQITCILTISLPIFSYTTMGSKMLKPSSLFGLLITNANESYRTCSTVLYPCDVFWQLRATRQISM
ncbi:hypothetical protein DSO57_1039764 [Entomophthora muscae]|uniref:Uncharacterized protein n=1 Tax=Entomophthora muscae TaxID=34485 RepID=A0ACC2U7S1_9FUNG|nr:hypothetical protein DSO57_1039764 [Entomophthora muscae]